ncbi:MAG: hypothetical protein HOQ24_10960, partial [Mycobacteriaceae bacterium]|nr:hypothetical protein [Mycobacteriaceae bacterium]
MPEHFELEPDSLRNVADQHDRKASDLRAWGAVPDTWLAEFEQGYGTIAEPVRVALMHHYNQRKAATDDLAAIHEDTRDKLTLSAAVIESADTTLGQLIFAAYWFGSAEPALTTMVRPQTSDAASSRSTTMPNVATSHGHAMTDSHSNGSTAAPLPGQRDSAKDLDIGRAASDQSPPVAAHRAPAAADGFAVSATQG